MTEVAAKVVVVLRRLESTLVRTTAPGPSSVLSRRAAGYASTPSRMSEVE